jgi:hypothetical protein
MGTQPFLPLAPTVSVEWNGMEMIQEHPRIPLSVLLGVNFVDRGGGGGEGAKLF